MNAHASSGTAESNTAGSGTAESDNAGSDNAGSGNAGSGNEGTSSLSYDPLDRTHRLAPPSGLLDRLGRASVDW